MIENAFIGSHVDGTGFAAEFSGKGHGPFLIFQHPRTATLLGTAKIIRLTVGQMGITERNLLFDRFDLEPGESPGIGKAIFQQSFGKNKAVNAIVFEFADDIVPEFIRIIDPVETM